MVIKVSLSQPFNVLQNLVPFRHRLLHGTVRVPPCFGGPFLGMQSQTADDICNMAWALLRQGWQTGPKE